MTMLSRRPSDPSAAAQVQQAVAALAALHGLPVLTVADLVRCRLPVDSRHYGVGAQMLLDLGVRRMRLVTNNPAKYGGLDGYGLEIVGRVPLPSAENGYNTRYLRTKRDRMGHLGLVAQESRRPA